MKSIETIFSDLQESILLSKVSATLIAEKVKPCKTVEEKVSALKKLAADNKISESAPVRVKRNNGSAINESAITTVDERVAGYMTHSKMSFREATIMATGKDPGPNSAEPKAMTEARKERWRAYAPFLTEAELTKLAEKQIEP